MDLTIRQAAPLLGRSARAVRARIARGELAARKEGRTWKIPLDSLPLTNVQRDNLLRRADEARDAVGAVLPSRLGDNRERKRRSVLDLAPFAAGVRLVRELGAAPQDAHPDLLRAIALLRAALMALATASFEFQPVRRANALGRARVLMGRVVGLLLSSPQAVSPAAAGWCACIEQEIVPPIGGLLRWLEGSRRSR
jgi:excisionase family DNA binding protein